MSGNGVLDSHFVSRPKGSSQVRVLIVKGKSSL